VARVDALCLLSTGHLLRILIPLEEPPHLTGLKRKQALNGCSVGFSVGSQWVLSGYSVSTQGTHGYSWVLRLFIFEYSGGSQVGTSPRCVAVGLDDRTCAPSM